ncbi:hypothetical protein AB1J28_11770 [Lysinibacillus irui]|uniref:hypothetical protein n=1 Tax=Lysinibacillus irui TaxID=2998077 RepID=UPI003D295B39
MYELLVKGKQLYSLNYRIKEYEQKDEEVQKRISLLRVIEKLKYSHTIKRGGIVMDILRFNYSTLLKRSKSRSYQLQVMELTKVLMTFLIDNSLINLEPFNENGSIKEDLIIRKSNLSDVGNQLFNIYYPKWSNYIDRGGSIENIKILENGLRALQKTKI